MSTQLFSQLQSTVSTFSSTYNLFNTFNDYIVRGGSIYPILHDHFHIIFNLTTTIEDEEYTDIYDNLINPFNRTHLTPDQLRTQYSHLNKTKLEEVITLSLQLQQQYPILTSSPSEFTTQFHNYLATNKATIKIPYTPSHVKPFINTLSIPSTTPTPTPSTTSTTPYNHNNKTSFITPIIITITTITLLFSATYIANHNTNNNINNEPISDFY